VLLLVLVPHPRNQAEDSTTRTREDGYLALFGGRLLAPFFPEPDDKKCFEQKLGAHKSNLRATIGNPVCGVNELP
jgi:hypothetical protein